jgi:hypothetical protein
MAALPLHHQIATAARAVVDRHVSQWFLRKRSLDLVGFLQNHTSSVNAFNTDTVHLTLTVCVLFLHAIMRTLRNAAVVMDQHKVLNNT